MYRHSRKTSQRRITVVFIWATVNIMDSRAMLRLDIGYYIGTI